MIFGSSADGPRARKPNTGSRRNENSKTNAPRPSACAAAPPVRRWRSSAATAGRAAGRRTARVRTSAERLARLFFFAGRSVAGETAFITRRVRRPRVFPGHRLQRDLDRCARSMAADNINHPGAWLRMHTGRSVRFPDVIRGRRRERRPMCTARPATTLLRRRPARARARSARGDPAAGDRGHRGDT